MNKISLSILFFAFTTFLNAQKFEWAKRMGETVMGTSHQHEGKSIALDKLGNIYTTGYFSTIVDFDPGLGIFNLTSVANDDIFVSKLDALGNFIWAKQMGGTANGTGYSIALDTLGNVYTTGMFTGVVDFDPGVDTFNMSAASNDIFVSKLDASGNFIWAKKMGSSFSDIGYSIAVDAVGNVYTTGYFQGTADFDPSSGVLNLTAIGDRDIFISKLDDSGNFIWAKQMGGLSTDISNSIAVDTIGNVYTTGYFGDSADFDPGIGTFKLGASLSGFYPSIFVSKLDNNGNFIWAKKLGGGGNSQGKSIAVDKSGNVYTSGIFNGFGDFDPGASIFNLMSSGTGTVYVSKLNSTGNFIWAKQMGGGINDLGNAVTIDGSGNVYTTGYFSGTGYFTTGTENFYLANAGGLDIFVSKLDASGNFVWAKKMGGANNDVSNSIAVDANENTFTTGYFAATADFDPTQGIVNLTASGFRDIFVHKMSLCVSTTSTFSVAACSSYLSPDSNFVWTTSGTYITIIPNSTGCDSIIKILLTINQPSNSTIYNTICSSVQYQFGDSFLTASGTYTDTLQKATGCDSIVKLHLTVLPPIDISAGEDMIVCQNDTVQINAGFPQPPVCTPYYTINPIPYNAITPSGVTTAGPYGDDEVTEGITMPFPFQFFCNAVDSYFISTNGFVAFNDPPSNGCCSGQLLPKTALPNNLVTMIWEDLSTNSGGNINYFVSGNSPNRVLVIRFNNVSNYGGGFVSGEIHLCETTNLIEIHANSATATGQTYTIGIENATGTIGYSPLGYNAAPFTISSPVAFRFTPQTSENMLMSVHWMPSIGLSNNTILTPKAFIDTTITYTIAATLTNGCISYDSVIFTKTTSLQPVITYDTIYNGQSYQFGNSNLTTTGIYTDTIQTINGCDSVIVLNLSVKNCLAYYTLYPNTNTPYNWWAINQATGVGNITYNWQWGDGNSSNGAFPSHTYATAGNYNICLTISDSVGCSDTYCDSSTYIYKDENMVTINVLNQLPTNIQSALADSQYLIFPNPATNLLNITVEENLVGARLNIYNLTGALITSLRLQTVNNQLAIANYPTGVYIAEIKMENNIHRSRWVKM